MQLTGTLGDVMKESASAALSCARARADLLGLAPDFHRTRDLHLHIPSGATPRAWLARSPTTSAVRLVEKRSMSRRIRSSGRLSLTATSAPSDRATTTAGPSASPACPASPANTSPA